MARAYLVALLTFAIAPALAVPRPEPAEGRAEVARKFIDDLRASATIPALQAAVSVDGRIVWSYAAGTADLATATAPTPSSRFRIGSVSKSLTAAAAARLAERGLLNLDAPVQRYVPAFPDKGHTITPRQLAGHLGGIRHYRGAEFFNKTRYDSVGASLKIFADDPLVAPPGTKYSYSTYGYTLLSAVVEAAAGRPFLDHMTRDLFEPAGMTLTVPDKSQLDTAGKASFYERDKAGHPQIAQPIDVSDRWGAGGFLSTADDLVRFGSSLMNGRLVKPETLAMILTSQKTIAGEPTNYGLGWRLKIDDGRLTYAHHGGEAMGGRAFLLIAPGSRAAVAILANLGGAPFGDRQAWALLRPFIETPAPAH